MTIYEAKRTLWNAIKDHKYAVGCKVTVGRKETYITVFTLGNIKFQTEFGGYIVKSRKIRETREIRK